MAQNTIEIPIRLIDQFGKPLRELGSGLDSASKKVEAMGKSQEKAFGAGITPRLIGVAGAIFSIGKAVSFATSSYKESIEAASQIEMYETSLKTLMGTADKARERMQEYFRIAKQTPFQLNEVVEAGNKLQALGRYSEQNLIMMGDLAAASGKPMEQAMAAYTKLVIGEKGIAANMFRDLLITANDWTKATGKGVSKTGELLATTEEMIAVLPQIMKSKGYLGMMSNQAETTTGRVSNLKDTYYQLQVAVGERLKPAYDSLVVSLTKTVDSMKQYYEIPVAEKIAREKVELNLLVESLINHNGTQEQRKTLIDDINRKYPNLFSNLDLEKAKTSEIRVELEKVNAEYDKKMRKASYQRMREKIEGEMGEAADDVMSYQLSIEATKKIEELKKKYRNLNENIVGDAGDARTPSRMIEIAEYYAEKGKAFRLAGYKGGGDYNLTPQERADFATIASELKANLSFQNTFASWDKKRLEKAQKEYERYKNQLSTLNKLIGEDVAGQSLEEGKSGLGKGSGQSSEEGKSGLGKIAGQASNDVKGQASNEGKSTTSSVVREAADVISGGGKNVKNFNITIGNLIGENVNQFQASTDNPQTASDFVKRFGDTLQMLVNEVNYADN